MKLFFPLLVLKKARRKVPFVWKTRSFYWKYDHEKWTILYQAEWVNRNGYLIYRLSVFSLMYHLFKQNNPISNNSKVWDQYPINLKPSDNPDILRSKTCILVLLNFQWKKTITSQMLSMSKRRKHWNLVCFRKEIDKINKS